MGFLTWLTRRRLEGSQSGETIRLLARQLAVLMKEQGMTQEQAQLWIVEARHKVEQYAEETYNSLKYKARTATDMSSFISGVIWEEILIPGGVEPTLDLIEVTTKMADDEIRKLGIAR